MIAQAAELLADPALRAVLAALPGARLVGGCVRDLLAGRPVTDIDLATPDPPDRVLQRLAAAGLRSIPTGLAHGTVTAMVGARGFEVTSLRRDVQTDGRHAVVAYTGDWPEDARRRDFTCNAMSMAPDGTLHDYCGGLADLQAGRVRFVGDPAARIAEDRLRILRFFRFHTLFGRIAPDAATLGAIADAAPALPLLSPERVWSELKRLLAAPAPSASLRLMAACGVLAQILPDGFDLDRLDRLVAAGAPADPLLRLAALACGNPDALAERLRLSGAERERLHAAQGPPPGAADTELRQALAETPADILLDRLWLAGAPAGLRARLAALPRPVFPLQGRDLAARGIAPGPEMGEWLRRLRAWWHDGGCRADAAACLAEFERLRHGGDRAGGG